MYGLCAGRDIAGLERDGFRGRLFHLGAERRLCSLGGVSRSGYKPSLGWLYVLVRGSSRELTRPGLP